MKKKIGAVHCGAEVVGTGSPQWKKAIVASAAALVALGVSLDAQAVALGAITVRSALGEPLRAEIEVPQISSEEAASFKASMASPQAFRAAGIEYVPALSGARLTLERRSNGQAYLRLLSDRPINEPLLSVVIEANWATGRMVRDYTMLVDPPGRAPAPAATSNAAPPPSSTRPESERPPSVVRAPVAEQTTPAGKSRAAQPRRQSEEANQVRAPRAGGSDQIVVRKGDTAYRIASANLPEGVSLDQMLVAMLRANPNAFIRDNVNLMKSGAVLQMPTAEEANAMPRAAARRAVRAQSRDFHAYRQGLAQNTPGTQVEAAKSSASGRVTAQVQESSSAPPSPDRLTLSKGAAAATAQSSNAEAGVSQSRQAQEQSDRIAELNRNINELARLQGGSAATAAASAPAAGTTNPSVPSIGVTTGAASADSTPAAASTQAASAASTSVAAASAAIAAPAASTPVAAASAEPAKTAPAPKAKPAPLPESDPSFLDSLTENPLLPMAGAGLLALLLGYSVYRSRQKKKAESALDSVLSDASQGDSFFGSSGGEHVDTNEHGSRMGGQSSMIYSPSQIDAAGDVDPVAEADVYLAYGRDMQAEEILKEALRTHPGRISIHRKLADIYTKRRDPRALEAVAIEARTLTNGSGPDWSHIQSLGRSLDPANALYATEGVFAADKPDLPSARANGFGPDTSPMPSRVLDEQGPPSNLSSLDLDLENALVKATPKKASPTAFMAGTAAASPPASSAESAAMLPPDMPSLDFDLDTMPGMSPTVPATPTPKEEIDSGMIEFDLESLSADPSSRSSERNTEQPEDADDDPLSTKLELAQEFHAIGDKEGALSLIKEVVAEATGPVKARAERFLRELT